MQAPIPLPTLLSWPLVAFTVEFDNEAEHQLPHRTTRHGVVVPDRFDRPDSASPRTPWLVSLAMYMNCLRFVDGNGLPLAELHRLARTETNLNGMTRWGYITFAPDPAGQRAKPPRSAWIVRSKPGGQMVRDVCQTLLPEIESRWRQRFGASTIEDLRLALIAIVPQLDPGLPDTLPILGYGLRPGILPPARLGPPSPAVLTDLPLPALLSRVLLAFDLEFERQSEVSLAICANLLRLLENGPARTRDLPQDSGISKEAVAVGTGFLTRHGYATQQPEAPGSRIKTIALTAKGELARSNYLTLLAAIEKQWRTQYGPGNIDRLRAALSQLVAESTHPQLPLIQAIEPYPEGWRASLPKAKTLPHFPLILHRGGFPDGS